MDRREFLSKAAMAAALIGVTVTVTDCGGDDPAAPATGSGDIQGMASVGHTHFGVITKAQLDAGLQTHVTFSGGSDPSHTHSLPLLDSEVQKIARRERFEKTFTDTHTHLYAFN